MMLFNRSRKNEEREKLAALGRSFAIIEFTPEGNILSANENFCKLLGYAQAEIVGKHHSLFVEPDFARSPDYQAFWRKLGGGAYDDGAYKRLCKDGSPVFIRASYNPLLGPGGRVVSVMKVASDVTQEKLRTMEMEAKMAALSRAQAVIEFKPTGEVLDANDNFFATTGYRREDVIGRHHRMFVDHAYAASDAYRDFWRKLNAGEAIAGSFHRIGQGGKKIWLQASYNPVVDLSGKVVKVIKFAYDITDLLLLGEGLTRMSNNDLRQRLDKPFGPTFDKLRVDFNVAADNLNLALAGVTQSVDTVGASAEEISTASRDLSRRTEGQAASLEETAAALTQVAETLQRTTKNAQLTRQTVGAAKGDAEKSGEIVGRAVDAMGRIEHSSQEISKIISVIDEIAFQTNLLALNAGVEAARAGEAGRGFAVVASEVRALAQRSAEAAKQIKTLIATSGADVEVGVKLVRQTGEALGAIVAKVMEINTLVSDIASGTEEQNSALREVNTAVNEMDQSTQQNAAMAEQANAAVESMKQQIEQLRDTVANFKLAGGDKPRAAARAPHRRAA